MSQGSRLNRRILVAALKDSCLIAEAVYKRTLVKATRMTGLLGQKKWPKLSSCKDKIERKPAKTE